MVGWKWVVSDKDHALLEALALQSFDRNGDSVMTYNIHSPVVSESEREKEGDLDQAVRMMRL